MTARSCVDAWNSPFSFQGCMKSNISLLDEHVSSVSLVGEMVSFVVWGHVA